MNTLRRIFSLTLLTAAIAATGIAHAAEFEARTVKFPSASNKGHPQVQGVEKFAELMAKKTQGKFKVQAFPGGALGPDLQTVAAMQGGTVEMTVMNASLLAGVSKEMAIFDFPFMFNNTREADAVSDGPVGKKLLDKLQEKGLVGLAYWDLGFRQIHTGKKPIAKADDFKGMKMRVIPTPIYVDFMKSLGASPVPMPFTETYTAMEQGAIDGMTNPLLNILDGKYDEVSKYLTITNHMYTPQAVVVSKKFWDKLTAEEQTLMREAAQETAIFQRKVARDEAAKVLADIKKKGMTVFELNAEEIAKLRNRSKPVIDKYTKELGPIVDEMYAAVDKVRKAK
ncbi:MAG: TRAP transporter substrate-binding protein [Limnohabitans sp.]|nr:TRAP transporter substrate-binding protein [Limnohabitans sp.]